MSWEPGKPVITPDDVEAWKAWRKASKLQQQRERRAMYPRIDYYPSKEARAVILAYISNRAGGDYSSVIDRIIREWADIPE
jgi:hypothetical protein